MRKRGEFKEVPYDPAVIRKAAQALQGWLEGCGYAGIEPHDALTSPLIARTPLGKSKLLRLVALQGLRRFPLNLRGLLGIRPQVNAISLGWALKAYCLMDDPQAAAMAGRLVDQLKACITPGYSGACWGYYFPWQTRQDMKPGNVPIIVSIAFIGSGLLDAYQRYGRADCLELARSACNVILHDMRRTDHGADGFCFSYTPHDHEQVYNASILAAALLCRTGMLTGQPELTQAAREAARFVVRNQNADGSWGYAWGDRRSGFIDNFHTGYVLDALQDCVNLGGMAEFAPALVRGFEFYRDNFFYNGCVPKYYHNNLYPIDAHAASQAIVTLTRFGLPDRARQVAAWAVANMQTKGGWFIYRIERWGRNRIPYLRWSNAWMLYALRLVMKADLQ